MNLIQVIKILLINIGVLKNQQKPKYDLHKQEKKKVPYRFNFRKFFSIKEMSPVKLFILILIISIIMTICVYQIIPPLESGVYYRFRNL